MTAFSDITIQVPYRIVAGPDGALWFVNLNNSIGRITTSGTVTNFKDPSIATPYGIAAGSDGALWFTNEGNNSIGRITVSGQLTNYTDPGIGHPYGIAAGPDGALWFANQVSRAIGRITTSATPFIRRVAPHSAPVGTHVTITGRNLAGALAVAFNGTPAAVVSDTATQIVVTVPAGATTGRITVTTPAGIASSPANFAVS